MAQESSIINGASSESLGPYTEAFFAIVGGVIIGFYFCWQESLVTLACVPFMVVSQYMGVLLEKGISGSVNEAEKAANLLIGDAINNFKTVQSFGHERLIVEKYVTFLRPIYKANRKKHILSGIAFGFSQFAEQLCFAMLFYFAGWLIDRDCTIYTPEGSTKAL